MATEACFTSFLKPTHGRSTFPLCNLKHMAAHGCYCTRPRVNLATEKLQIQPRNVNYIFQKSPCGQHNSKKFSNIPANLCGPTLVLCVIFSVFKFLRFLFAQAYCTLYNYIPGLIYPSNCWLPKPAALIWLEERIRQFLVARSLVCCHFWVSFVLWSFQVASNFSLTLVHCSLHVWLILCVRLFLHGQDAC